MNQIQKKPLKSKYQKGKRENQFDRYDCAHWWKLHESTWPDLFHVVEKKLGRPCDSTDVEAIFSISLRYQSDKRRRLGDDHIELQTMLNYSSYLTET
jgi:hypothetical protein